MIYAIQAFLSHLPCIFVPYTIRPISWPDHISIIQIAMCELHLNNYTTDRGRNVANFGMKYLYIAEGFVLWQTKVSRTPSILGV